jgi:hypothetical protein
MFSRPLNLQDLPLINSTDPSFELELHRRRAFFVDHDDDARVPQDLDAIELALNSAPPRTSTRSSNRNPNDQRSLANFQRRLRNSCNEAAVVQSVMPQLVPIEQLLDRDDVCTVANQQWDKDCALAVPAAAQYRIPPPKPDQTIGLAAGNFAAFETALAFLARAARPIRLLSSLTFPLVTVEAKGDRGHNVCRSQSLHNAAVMLHQLLRLWELTGKVDDLFGRSMVCTIAITTQTCAVSQYWLDSGPHGISVYGRLLKSWTLNLKDSTDLATIICSIRNLIDFTLHRGIELIIERLEVLEEKALTLTSPSASPGSRKRRLEYDDSNERATPSPPERIPPPKRRASSRRSSRGSSRRSNSQRSSSGLSSGGSCWS